MQSIQVEVTNGKGLIQIHVEDGCCYFKYEKPLSIVWDDREGSIAQFLTVIKQDGAYRNTINLSINDILYNDYTGNLEDAAQFLKPLLELFENGIYQIAFSSADQKEFFNTRKQTAHWRLYITNATDVSKTIDQIVKYKNFRYKNSFNSDYYQSNLLDFSTRHFYNMDGCGLIATQPEESINEERVKFFKEEIMSERRPFAIIASKDSEYFVLDGHHKLLAYEQLGIYPPLLFIFSEHNESSNAGIDLEEVRRVLFPWQYKHFAEK